MSYTDFQLIKKEHWYWYPIFTLLAPILYIKEIKDIKKTVHQKQTLKQSTMCVRRTMKITTCSPLYDPQCCRCWAAWGCWSCGGNFPQTPMCPLVCTQHESTLHQTKHRMLKLLSDQVCFLIGPCITALSHEHTWWDYEGVALLELNPLTVKTLIPQEDVPLFSW